MFARGALSRRFPERHTTRTFEIPACGTVLITEWNEEISVFLGEKSVSMELCYWIISLFTPRR